MERTSEEFQVLVNYKGAYTTVYCSRFWGYPSVIIHCTVDTGAKGIKPFNFQDITGEPLIDLIILEGIEDLNCAIKKELEKIRSTFKVYSEQGRRMYPDWEKGEQWSYLD